MTRYCSSCGKEMGDASTFCPSCGKEAAPAAAGGTGVTPGAQGAGLQNNIAGALAYLWITAIVFLLAALNLAAPAISETFVNYPFSRTTLLAFTILATLPNIGPI